MTAHGIHLDTTSIRAFCEKWKIRELSVFGSILRNDFRADSDVDFLVDYHEHAEWDLLDSIRMKEELEEIIGRRADIVDRIAIESDGNRFVRKEIISSAEPIYVG
jgi:hypothetical protein